ncbi:gamma-glutamylcyclotransferase [Candidatus Contubernalis alkalaceticus]|nr:gamma-glutamylcyclotransferase [Candidatus Contubernalis alkalaceticus]
MDKLPDIDRYEGEGNLYKRKLVQVYSEDNRVFDSYVYVYNHSTAGKVKIDYEHQPLFEGITKQMDLKNLV